MEVTDLGRTLADGPTDSIKEILRYDHPGLSSEQLLQPCGSVCGQHRCVDHQVQVGMI